MIGNLIFQLFSYSVPIAFVALIWKCNARRWSRLAQAYRADDANDGTAKRIMQTVILVAGDIGWNSYKGIATVSVTRKGILLKLMKPFSVFHPPLLIPFGDCHIEPRHWYLIGKTVQYSLRGVSDVKMIVHEDLQDWIESQAASLAIAEEGTSETVSVPPKTLVCH